MTAAEHTDSERLEKLKAYRKAYYASPVVRARTSARLKKQRELDPEKFRKSAAAALPWRSRRLDLRFG